MLLKSNASKALAALALSLVAIFAPNPSNVLDSRMLAGSESEEATKARKLQWDTGPVYGPPFAQVNLRCGEKGGFAYYTGWRNTIDFVPNDLDQTVNFHGGDSLDLALTTTGNATVASLFKTSDLDLNEFLRMQVGVVPTQDDVIDPYQVSAQNPDFPKSFVTMELTYPDVLDGVYISMNGISSADGSTVVARIRMFDEAGSEVPVSLFSVAGDVEVRNNFGYQPRFGVNPLPGPKAGKQSLYGMSLDKVKSIKLDVSVFTYTSHLQNVGTVQTKSMFPAVDIQYCGGFPDFAGVNGDPLIMGLSGQLFKFDGLNEAWYSAVSTPSFQWNMKIQEYEKCPAHSNSFVTGAGFTFFDKATKTSKKIEVNVVNPYHVDVGCDDKDMDNCLGAGSLEIMIDGIKHIVGGDYKSEDGTARVMAFNTFHQCSRKWYDFDVRPTISKDAISLRSGRRLSTSEKPSSIFDVISGLKRTMIDKEVCEKWIHERQKYGDLFQQPGHYTTVIIKTPDVTLQLEYKQENERCDAHSMDVWISSVSESLLMEDWEGVSGETKDVNYVSTGKQVMKDRFAILKYDSDQSYEVKSSFSTSCKGCYQKK